MEEVENESAKLLLGPSVYLGKNALWDEYGKLYQKVYNEEGKRVLRKDGVFVVMQTNAYHNGKFVSRYNNLLNMLLPAGWVLLDEKIWIRQNADLYRVPFTNVLIFAPPNGTMKRSTLNKGNKQWFQGVWRYSPSGEADNSFPRDLCELIVRSTTDTGDLIVDTFAGSGKLGGVAHCNAREYVGYELLDELIPTIHANGCWVVKSGKTLRPPKVGLIK